MKLDLRPVVRAPIAWALAALEPLRRRRCAYELAICAIFRDEADFLDEWLRFHLGVGVEHVYLYNNFSTDHFRAVLAPWIEKGVVTLTDWPVAVGQLPAYRDCLRRFRREACWIAFIDIDEFLFAPGAQDIRPILREYRGWPGLAVWQRFFGSGGHVERPLTPVSLSYFQCAADTVTTVKTIANPRMVYKIGVHVPKFWAGEARDSSGRSIAPGLAPVFDRLRINHYWSRSLADLRDKIARGDASTADRRDPDWHYAFERTLNAEHDESIRPAAEAVFGV